MNLKNSLIIITIFLQIFGQARTFFKPRSQNQGDGATVTRIVGGEKLKSLDPFLMLDYFQVRLPAGFPDHPHRGFQTITYMKSGVFHHEDFKGHRGIIQKGDIQWMTAGRGIMHAEMPGSFEEDSIGFQLWLNLNASQKLKQPRYQQYKSGEIKTVKVNDTLVKLICGDLNGQFGVIQYSTPAYFLDVQINLNSTFQIQINKKWNSLVYIYDGEIQYQSSLVEKTDLIKNMTVCVLDKSDSITVVHKFTSKQKSKFIFLSGQPLNQPVYSYGPFVMNTYEQINQAFYDFRNSINGFQGAKQWSSNIKNMKSRTYFEQL